MRLVTLFALFGLAHNAPAQQYAVELQPGSEIQFPHHSVMNTGTVVTIEVWVKAMAAGNAERSIYNRYESGVHKSLVLRPDGSLHFLYAGSPWAHGLATKAAVFPFDNRWHHVAFVRHASGKYELYVDGSVVHAGGPGPCWLTCDITSGTHPTRINAASSGSAWAMAGLRVSTTDRYSSAFAPATTWQDDKQTVMLLQFPEGKGTTTTGSSSYKQVGTFSGTIQWIPGLQPAVFQTYGTGCAAASPVPSISSPAGPRIGKPFTLQMKGFLPKPQFGHLILGMSDKVWGIIPLPLNLAVINMPNCTLSTSLDWSGRFVTDAMGNSTAAFPTIPANASIIGTTFFGQAWAPDPNANGLGVAMTNAFRAVVGMQ